jgi:thiosulfate dehydrogenase (quinone) large subunit
MRIVGRYHRQGVALLRVVVGIIFIWAGLDKLLGAGPKGFSAAGFLSHATSGSLGWPFVTGTADPNTIYNPTHGFWVSLAGNAGAMTVVNFLVVAGELGIGIALILGLLTRFASLMGALMMLFFFFAAWSFSNGVVNEHLTYLVVCLTLAGIGAGRYYGLDATVGRRFGSTIRTWFLSGEEIPAAA